MKRLISLIFLSFTSWLFTQPLLVPSTASLEVKAGSFNLNMDVSLIESEGIWEVSSSINGIAKREEKERFILDGNKIIPLNYLRKEKILFRKTESKVDFDWRKKELKFVENGKSDSIKLFEEVLGPSTATLKLRIDIKKIGLDNLPEEIKYFVYFKGKIKERTYKLGDMEEVSTPMGKIEALKVYRVFKEGENRKQIYWLSPAYDFALVKIIDKNSDRESIVRIKSIE